MTATDLDLDALLDALAARAAARATPVRNVAGAEVTPLGSNGRLVVHPGDTIASVWGNTTYDQTVQQYASVADRNTQWPTPADGSVSYTTDTGTLWVRRSGAWKALPLGWVAQIVGPAALVNVAQNTTIMALTAPVQAGRRYRLTAFAAGSQQTAASTNTYFNLAGPNDNVQGRFFQMPGPSGVAVGGYTAATGVWPYSPSASGNQTWTLSGFTSAGTISVAANQCHILLEDIGA